MRWKTQTWPVQLYLYLHRVSRIRSQFTLELYMKVKQPLHKKTAGTKIKPLSKIPLQDRPNVGVMQVMYLSWHGGRPVWHDRAERKPNSETVAGSHWPQWLEAWFIPGKVNFFPVSLTKLQGHSSLSPACEGMHHMPVRCLLSFWRPYTWKCMENHSHKKVQKCMSPAQMYEICCLGN